MEAAVSGYIECDSCCHWFHRSCCNLDDIEDQTSSSSIQFICLDCSPLRALHQEGGLETETLYLTDAASLPATAVEARDVVMREEDTVLFIPAANTVGTSADGASFDLISDLRLLGHHN